MAQGHPVQRLHIGGLLQMLHRRQGQELVHQHPQPLHLLQAVGAETGTVLRWQVFGQQLGGALYRSQWAFEFVRQAVHVLLHIGFALELLAHGLQRLRQVVELGAPADAPQPWQLHPLAIGHRLRVALEARHRACQPPAQQQAQQQGQAQHPATPGQDALLAALNVGPQSDGGFGHRQHANDALAIAHRRGHMHDRAARVLRV